MGRFLSEKYKGLEPYIPGEQPKVGEFIKLNTNENPYPPSADALEEASRAAGNLNLYNDPDCNILRDELAKLYGVDRDEIVFGNGSDEILSYAFMAFCDKEHPIAFPDISYGFYPILAGSIGCPYTEIPVEEDLSICTDDYLQLNCNIVFANPNAPSGLALQTSDIERICRSNPNNVVIVDEAYVDFGWESCVPLIHSLDNLLVVQTFSKSRSLAGGRLGFAVGCKELIADINAIRNATNPYNINSVAQAMGAAIFRDDAYTKKTCSRIIKTRDTFAEGLRELGFYVTDSHTNFVFAKHPAINGEELYKKLKERGVLVRHFKKEKICEYIRISIGTDQQMETVLRIIGELI